jgi:hypothetical protein
MPASRPYAHFSPSVLCTSYEFGFPKGRARDEPKASDPLPTLLDDAHSTRSWEYANKVASVLHERRHFHDWVGTSLGMQLFYHLQRVVNQYLLNLEPNAVDVSSLQFPLRHTKGVVPGGVQSFLEDYDAHMSQYDWLMAAHELPRDYATRDPLSEFTLPDSGLTIPVLNLQEVAFVRNGKVEPFPQKCIPLGGLHIIEALAFITEAMQLRRHFGPDFEARLNEVVLSSTDGWNYGIVTGAVQVILGSLPLEATMSACEFALWTPGSECAPEEQHPGWRFIHILLELSNGTDFSVAGFSNAVDRLCRKQRWTHPRDVVQASKRYTTAQLAHNRRSPHMDDFGIVKAYNELYYRLADTLVDYHLSTRFPDRNPFRYLDDVAGLPSQPLSRFQQADGTHKLVSADTEQGRILVHWAILEHLVHEITETGNLTCPLKYGPALGDSCPMRTSDCGVQFRYVERDGQVCPYGETLSSFGFFDIAGARHVRRPSVAEEPLGEAPGAEHASNPVSTGKCDFCGRTDSMSAMTIVEVDTLVVLTTRGFVPSRLRLPPDLAAAGMTRELLWLGVLEAFVDSQWGVCSDCTRDIQSFMTAHG